MLRKWLFYPLGLFLCLVQVSQAAGPSGISVTHCTTNCGKVLVGAARVDMASIQWQGADSQGLILALYGAKSSDSLGNRFFGFTGSFDSNGTPNAGLIDYTGSAINKWFFVSTGEVSIGEPAAGSKAPKLGFYFSPSEAKIYDSSSSYFAACTGSSCQQGYPAETLTLKGEGVGDSTTAPALTLDVTVNGATTAQQDVSVTSRSTTQFAITPKLNTGLVPTDVQPVKYAQVVIKVDEQGTGCTNINRLVSFSEAQEEPNDFSVNSYYHHLVPTLSNQGKCSRVFSYLVSIDKTFNLDVTNQQMTGSGYVQYTFYINGHYNPFSPVESNYPNSHKTFRLRTDSTVVSNQKPTASFSVSNQSANVNQSIALDASASFDSDGSIAAYEWTSLPKATFTTTNAQKTSVSFSQAGTYTVTLKVTDNKGESSTYSQNISVQTVDTPPTQATLTINMVGNGTVKSADGTINCSTSSCSKSYTKNIAITLTPTAMSGYQFSSWSGVCINNVKANGEVTLTLDSDKTCDVTFTKTSPSSNLKAVLQEPIVTTVKDNPAKFSVTLDASQSIGSITGYEVQIYNSQQADKPIITREPALNSPIITEELPVDGSYAIYLIVKNANTNPTQSDITSRTLSTLPMVDFIVEPNAERVTLTAKLITNLQGLTYRWLCEKCLWKSRNNNVIDETTGKLSDEALEIGIHILKLLVLDSSSKIVGSAAKVVEIKKNSPPIASFTVTPQEVALGKTPEIKLDASDSTDPDGGKLQYSWTVDSTKGTLETDPTDVTSNAKRIFKPNQSVFNPSLSDATASISTVDFGFNLTVVDDEPAPQQAISNPSFKITLPTAQFTVQQNNLVIALESQGSAGVTFAPAQKASTIQKYEWRLDNVLHYESATDKMVLTAGKHQVSLKLIDSYGYTREVVKEVLATTATVTSTALNAQGGRVNTSSKFAASLPTSTVIAAQPIAIPISFQIDAEDVGKQVDLLLAVGIEPTKMQYTGMDANYFAIVLETAYCPGSMMISGGYCPVNLYATPDVWMAQLTEPYERVKTAESNMVRTLTRAFSAAGMHYIFAGYRRPDNTIVYSAQPVAQFEVK